MLFSLADGAYGIRFFSERSSLDALTRQRAHVEMIADRGHYGSLIG